MGNGNSLKVSVTPIEFSSKGTDEKLDLIFQAVSTQQVVCVKTVKSFSDHFIENDKLLKEAVKVPKRNRKVDLGVGAGTGTVGGVVVVKLIDLIKNFISGG